MPSLAMNTNYRLFVLSQLHLLLSLFHKQISCPQYGIKLLWIPCHKGNSQHYSQHSQTFPICSPYNVMWHPVILWHLAIPCNHLYKSHTESLLRQKRWPDWGLNPGPPGHIPVALTNWAIRSYWIQVGGSDMLYCRLQVLIATSGLYIWLLCPQWTTI